MLNNFLIIIPLASNSSLKKVTPLATHKAKMSGLYFLFFFVAATFSISAQVSSPDTSSNQGIKFATELYNQAMGQTSHLYNGREDVNYNFRLNGHPYFDGRDFKTGSVLYDGEVYENISLMYNLLSQELITKHYGGYIKIQLTKGKVKSFTIAGHSFVNISLANDKKGVPILQYYDLISDGNTKFIIYRNKIIDELITSDSQVRRDVLERNELYILKNGNLEKIHSKNSVLNVLKDKKKEIQNYMKESNINFKENPEVAIMKITEYYNSIGNE